MYLTEFCENFGANYKTNYIIIKKRARAWAACYLIILI